MVNCIIYEDNLEMQVLYKDVVYSYFLSKKQKVKFYIFDKYQNNLETKLCKINDKKIFILDVEVPGKSGLDLARNIRKEGDWKSPMIIVTTHEHLKNATFTSRMLMLDFISKKESLIKRLQEALKISEDIFNIKDNYTFQYNGELHHVNYHDILSFEKDLNDNYTFLYTKSGFYKIKESITKIEKELINDKYFLKIHRSCIINIENITQLNLKDNTLYLQNYSTNLLTKDKRDFLIKALDKYQIIN